MPLGRIHPSSSIIHKKSIDGIANCGWQLDQELGDDRETCVSQNDIPRNQIQVGRKPRETRRQQNERLYLHTDVYARARPAWRASRRKSGA